MPVASPPQAVAFTDPIEFTFAWRNAVKAQVRFYSDAAGTAAIAKGTGGRDIDVTTEDTVHSTDETYRATLESDYKDGTQTLAGGEWGEFAFADGARTASFACSGGSDPGGAVSYRVILSISQEVP